MLKPEIKEKWVTALTSGEYTQGREQLKTPDGNYCCLGVLCDLYIKETQRGEWDRQMIVIPDGVNGYSEHESLLLPETVAVWSGVMYNDASQLANLNDGVTEDEPTDPMTFVQIAEYIKENL